jgi:quinol monooxygenase YgiN
MYGTIARMRVKPGMEERLLQLAREPGPAATPGLVFDYAYRMDANRNEYFLAVAFESREAFLANAARPEQHAQYLAMRALLEADPEWHDGEVVFAYPS